MVLLKADMNVPVQDNFCGLGAIYHAYAGMPDDAGRVYTDEQALIEVNRAADMRLKIARSYFSWYAWEPETDTWDWDNARCTAFYNWARRLKERGIEISINTGWVNVGDLQGDYWGGPCPFKVEGDWEATVAGYAKWVSQLVFELIEKRGLDNIKYFNLFTEPNECVAPTRPFEGAEYHKLWYDCAIAAHNQLVADGRRDKIMLMGPQEGISSNRPWFTEWAIKEKHCDEFLDAISFHHYLSFVEAREYDVHSGYKSLIFPFPGSRTQLEGIKLKKNTDYKMSVWLKIKAFAEVVPDSEMLLGIFSQGSFWHYFNHYCEPRDAIEALHIKASDLKDEWQKFEFSFNSGEHDDVTVCLYDSVRRQDGKKDTLWFGLPYERGEGVCVLADDISLKELETGNELLPDNSFESNHTWRHLWCRNNGTDAYETLQTYERVSHAVIPDRKKTPYWHDEYNYNSGSTPMHKGEFDEHYGVIISLSAVAMMNEGGQGSFIWTLFDQQWPNNHTNSDDSFVDGDHRCGLMPVLTRSLVPYTGYYAWGMVSRYTGGRGTKCYRGINCSEERVVMNVQQLPDGNVTFTVVNYSEKEQDIKLYVNRCFGRDFYRHTYVSGEVVPDETATLPQIDKTFPDVSDTICDTLKPMSVAVYTTMND